MTSCPKCGFELPADAAECPACGIVLEKFVARSETGAEPPPHPAPAEAGIYEPDLQPMSAGPGITTATLDALSTARPWLRFMVGYGFVVTVLMFLGGAGLFVGGFWREELRVAAVIYLVYGTVTLVILLPLRRSAQALRNVGVVGASEALESFAIHQAAFWRRVGILTAISIAVVILGLAVAVLFGVLMSAGQ